MYVHELYKGTNGANEQVILNPNLPNFVGLTYAYDWDIRDGPDTKTNVVGRAQGLYLKAGMSPESGFLSLNIVFTDERLKGSTLSVQGTLGAPPNPGDPPKEGEWIVVGGSGSLTYAQGIVTYKRALGSNNTGTIIELNIRVVTLTFPKPTKKVAPLGGSGGTAFEIPMAEMPQRLESVTIGAGIIIDSIAFTYIDQAGTRRSVGPLGGSGGNKSLIQLAPSETVREIYGSTGNFSGQNVVRTLKIVTSAGTVYGPYGTESSGSGPFHEVAPDNHGFTGFYGRTSQFVNQLGFYVGPN